MTEYAGQLRAIFDRIFELRAGQPTIMYDVTIASIDGLFNGPGHHEDPVDKGWIGPDGVHPSEAGTAAQVDFLDSLGYDPVHR